MYINFVANNILSRVDTNFSDHLKMGARIKKFIVSIFDGT